jgi:hypothetical protein
MTSLLLRRFVLLRNAPLLHPMILSTPTPHRPLLRKIRFPFPPAAPRPPTTTWLFTFLRRQRFLLFPQHCFLHVGFLLLTSASTFDIAAGGQCGSGYLRTTHYSTTTRQHPPSTTRVFRFSRDLPRLSFSIAIICIRYGDTQGTFGLRWKAFKCLL